MTLEPKGGLTIPLLHCLFHGEAVTHFLHEYDPALYAVLPNLYAACIAQTEGGRRSVVAGLFVKTSYSHHDEEFADALTAAMSSIERLRPLVGPRTSFLPSRVTLAEGSTPITEWEMLRTLHQKWLQHSSAGAA